MLFLNGEYKNLGLTLATARVRIVSSSPPFARSEPLKLTLSRKNGFMIIIGFLFSSVFCRGLAEIQLKG
jgi:hypothetical protein